MPTYQYTFPMHSRPIAPCQTWRLTGLKLIEVPKALFEPRMPFSKYGAYLIAYESNHLPTEIAFTNLRLLVTESNW